MDAHTESELLKSLNASLTAPDETTSRRRTSIFIAHRLRTVIEADFIIVMKEGEVVEQGTHEELLKQGGLYWSMWMQQSLGSGGLGGSVDGEEIVESETEVKI